MISDERLEFLLRQMGDEERDCKHAEVPHSIETDLLSALTELRQRRSVDVAVEAKLLELEAKSTEFPESQCEVTLLRRSNGDWVASLVRDIPYRLEFYAAETIHAALSALVGVEQEEQRKDGEG